jgi:hypothetical protein
VSTNSLLQQLHQYTNSPLPAPNPARKLRAITFVFLRLPGKKPSTRGASLLYTGRHYAPHCCLAACFALAAATATLHAQTPAPEARAARAYQAAAQAGPPALCAFLDQFSKDADLHIHLSGAVYAETIIRDAVEDKLCIDPAGLKFARDNQGDPVKEPCTTPLVPAAQLLANQELYDRLIDVFSMRGFVPTPGFSSHDQFFATFGRFGGLNKRHIGEWVDEVASRAAAQKRTTPPACSRRWPQST